MGLVVFFRSTLTDQWLKKSALWHACCNVTAIFIARSLDGYDWTYRVWRQSGRVRVVGTNVLGIAEVQPPGWCVPLSLCAPPSALNPPLRGLKLAFKPKSACFDVNNNDKNENSWRSACFTKLRQLITEHINVVGFLFLCRKLLRHFTYIVVRFGVTFGVLLFGNPFDSTFPILWLCLGIHLLGLL